MVAPQPDPQLPSWSRRKLEGPKWRKRVRYGRGILLFPRLGALAAAGLFVTGQMFASVGLDLLGLLGVSRQPVTAGIVIGATVVLAGITAIIRQRPPAPAPATTPAGRSVGAMAKPVATTGVRNAAWIALGIVAGGVLPVQGAINANLRNDLNAPITVAMISFIVATIAIAVVHRRVPARWCTDRGSATTGVGARPPSRRRPQGRRHRRR
jgi:uncharacterized membrane protein YdcZ (DUF606 family)